jgi:hypothetical protein
LMGNGSTEQELNSMSLATNEWMSFALVTVGSFLLIGGCLSYWRAVRWASYPFDLSSFPSLSCDCDELELT